MVMVLILTIVDVTMSENTLVSLVRLLDQKGWKCFVVANYCKLAALRFWG